MSKPVINPVLWSQIKGDLTAAERAFACCLSRGEPCELGKTVPQARHPRNTVRAEVIRFFAHGGDDKHVVAGTTIRLQGAWVWGDAPLDLAHVEIPYVLFFSGCHFDVPLGMMHSECVGFYLNGSCLTQGLLADGVKTKSSVSLRDILSISRGVPFGVRLLGADIGQNLECTGGEFRNPNGHAIQAEKVTVGGNVFMRGGFSAEGEVCLSGASIGGQLECVGGKFHNPNGRSLQAERITVGGGVSLGEGFSAEGEVCLSGASIGGQLECVGGKFHNPNGRSLQAERITVGGGVSLGEGFSAEGAVSLSGANIDGQLACVGGRFINQNPKEYALAADGMTASGNVFLGNKFFAEGGVRLFRSKIGGALDCAGGTFHNPSGISLGAEEMEVRGSVFLRDNFSAKGAVWLMGANIGRDLICSGGKFYNPNKDALVAEKAEIKGMLSWGKGTTGAGTVTLEGSKVGILADDLASWKPPVKVRLNGFSYGQFANPGDIQSRIEWLANRPKDVPFSPQPYEQAAKVLFGMGRDNDARAILLAKEQELSKHGKWKWWQKPLRWLWGKLAGYGYEPARTFVSMLVVVAIGWGVFHCADDYGRMVPHQPVVLANPDYNAEMAVATGSGECRDGPKPTEVVTRLFPDYPEFNALVYSADVFIPFFALHQEPYWFPARAKDGGFPWVTLWYWIEIVAGWILTSLFLLSVTGILRPRQSSGEKG